MNRGLRGNVARAGGGGCGKCLLKITEAFWPAFGVLLPPKQYYNPFKAISRYIRLWKRLPCFLSRLTCSHRAGSRWRSL